MILLVRFTILLFYVFTICIGIRVIYTAYQTIPLSHIFLSTIPNGFSFYFVVFICYESSNFFFLIYFLSNIFISKSIKSSTNRFHLKNLTAKDVIKMAKMNLKVIRDALNIFIQTQHFIDIYFIPYYSVMLLICLTFPYALIFGDNSLLSFLICFSLYIQAIFNPLYSTTEANKYLHEAFHNYGNFLHHLILKCSDVRLKLKLANFYAVHQKKNPITFNYFNFFHFSHLFLIKVFLKLIYRYESLILNLELF